MKKALVLIFDGFEEMEGIAPIDILRRAGVEVSVASVGAEAKIIGRSGIEVLAERVLFLGEKEGSDFSEFDHFDALVIPGGGGVFEIVKNDRLIELVKSFYSRKALLAAICAAPIVLKKAGVLSGKKCTAHFSVSKEFENFDEKSAVVLDENILTSQGAGSSTEFALALVEILLGENASKDIAKAICFAK